MRLTKEDIKQSISNKYFIGARIVGKQMLSTMCQELLEYKDIEEEIGIDLITFFKALENGVYAFNKKKNIVKGYIAIAYDNGGFENYLRFVLPDRLNCDELHFKDYGKTWALTKEELL